MTQSEKPNSNVLVTGATGFVGGRLVEKLVHEGYSVTCLVRESSDTRMLQGMAVRMVTGDLEENKALQEAVRGIHTVYHVAGAIKAANREQYFRVNQTGTRRLLQALADSNSGASRFIHVSSLAAAGPSTADRGLKEGEEPNPISWYGESKLGSEEEALKFADRFQVTILRPSAVYGPGDRETLIVFRMIKTGCLITPGRVIRRFSLVHVDDLVSALIRAGTQDTRSGEVFNVSRPESYTWIQVGQTIARSLNKQYRSIAFPTGIAVAAGVAGDLWCFLTGRPATISSQKIKELLQPSWICDTSKAAVGLGFVPSISLSEGISGTVRWYMEHGWL